MNSATLNAGDFDGGFNNGSPVMFNTAREVWAICPAPGNKTIGVYNDPDYVHFWMVRLNEDGTPDQSFGDGGYRKSRLSGSLLNPQLVGLSEGKYLLVSTTGINLEVARFKADGTDDDTFGEQGRVIVPMAVQPHAESGGTRLALLPSGGYLVHRSEMIAALSSSGSIDTNFAANGYLRLEGVVQDVVVGRKPGEQGICRLIVAHARDEFCRLSAFDLAGNVDESFAQGGSYTLPPLEGRGILRSVTVTPADEIVAAGGLFEFGFPVLISGLIVKLDGFGNAGFSDNKAFIEVISQKMPCELRAVSVGLDHLIVVAGWADDGEGGLFAVEGRFTPGGVADEYFGNGGWVVSGQQGSVLNAFQQGGKLVVAGSFRQPERAGMIGRFLL